MTEIREAQNDLKKALRRRKQDSFVESVAGLMEESGDLTRHLITMRDGPIPEGKVRMEIEERFGDTLLSLMATANRMDVDLEKVFNQSLRKMKIEQNQERTLKEALEVPMEEKHFVFHSTENWLEQLKYSYPQHAIHVDEYVNISEKFLQWLEEGKRTTFFRFEPQQIPVPKDTKLPVFDWEGNPPVLLGEVELRGFIVKPFREVTEEDAQEQGFASKLEFVQRQKNRYEKAGLDDYSLICLYKVERFIPLAQMETRSPND